MSQIYPAIYKRDNNGNVRIWWMERADNRYRTHHGIKGGAIVVSEWTTVLIARSKATPELQADFDVQSSYEHKLTREYHQTEATIDTPKFFRPMLAKKYVGWVKLKGEVVFSQPKLDGIRCIGMAELGHSREGREFATIGHILEALAPFFKSNPDAILDGELYNHDYKDDFNSIVSAVRKQDPSQAQLSEIKELVQYHVYDYPTWQGDFCGRSTALYQEMMIGDIDPRIIHLVQTTPCSTEAELDEVYGEYMENGYEGQMVRLDEEYEVDTRSAFLLKRKDAAFEDDEFELEYMKEGKGNWGGLARVAVCKLPDGRTFKADIIATKARAKELLGENHKVVTVKFQGYTPKGVPRFGKVTKFHGEKRLF